MTWFWKARIWLSSRSMTGYSARGRFGSSVVSGRPSAVHLARPPSIRRTSGCLNSETTHSAYAAHQLFRSP